MAKKSTSRSNCRIMSHKLRKIRNERERLSKQQQGLVSQSIRKPKKNITTRTSRRTGKDFNRKIDYLEGRKLKLNNKAKFLVRKLDKSNCATKFF